MFLSKISMYFSGIYATLSIAGFIMFTFVYGNLMAGTWALFTAIFCLAFFHLSWIYLRGKFLNWHDASSIETIICFTFVVSVISFAASIWFIFEHFYFHKGVYPISNSSVIKAVMASMCGKWTLAIFMKCRSVRSEYRLL